MAEKPRITLYEHVSTAGRELTLGEAVSNLVDRGFNDKCSSLVVHSGVWELFQHGSYNGDKWIVWAGQDYSQWSKWGGPNDVISSLRPIKVKIASHSVCRVFEHGSEKGKSLEIVEPVQNFKDYHFNDTISSVNVSRGTWVAYVDVNFQGAQILLQEGYNDVCNVEGRKFNDKISSMRPIEIDFPTKLISLDYDTSNAIINDKPKTLQTWTQVNNTSVEQAVTYTESRKLTVTNTSQFSLSTTDTIELSTGVTIGIPKIGLGGSININTSHSVTQAQVNGKQTSEENSWTVEVPTKVPPYSKVTMTCIINEGKADVPFKALLEKGDRRWFERGTWYGVQSFNFRTEYNEEKIN